MYYLRMASGERDSTPLPGLLPPAQPPTGIELRRAGRPDAFRLARRWFVAGRRLHMQDLAAELTVSRATLFRWVGNREQLLAEVIWSLAESRLRGAAAEARGRGGRRIAATVGGFAADVQAADCFRTYLAREPEAALRLLTTRAGGFRPRVVTLMRGLLEQEVAHGDLDPPMALGDLANLVVQIGEAFIYADLITGEPSDASRPAAAVAALLRD